MTERQQTPFVRAATDLYSNKAEVYAHSRPDFAPQAIAKFIEESGLGKECIVADIGSGTGMLTNHLLNHFDTVYAIEPNDDMRTLAEARLGQRTGFHSINSPAENIDLPDQLIGLICVGQAIHWFEPNAALSEFQRIAKPGAWLLLAHIQSLDEDLNEALVPIWTEENGCLPKDQQPQAFDVNVSNYFKNDHYHQLQFVYTHKENWQNFLGGIESASFAPNKDHPLYENFMRVAHDIFDQQSENGVLTWTIATEIKFGKLI